MKLNATGGLIAGKVTVPDTPASGVYTGTATVLNNPAFILPDTGGSGDTLYTDLGLLLLAFGLVLMARQNDSEHYDLRRGRNQ